MTLIITTPSSVSMRVLLLQYHIASEDAPILLLHYMGFSSSYCFSFHGSTNYKLVKKHELNRQKRGLTGLTVLIANLCVRVVRNP